MDHQIILGFIQKQLGLNPGGSKDNSKYVRQSRNIKVREHVGLRYESTNTKIATVTKKGTIKAISKGECSIYIYAQNGVYKKIKVIVK